MINFTFVTLFKSLISHYFEDSILKNAILKNLISIEFVNPRDFSSDKFKRVDDYQSGGGAGLLLKPEPLSKALKSIKQAKPDAYMIFTLPCGKPFKQIDAKRLSSKKEIVLVSGRYEGIDERVVEKYADEIFSIGDFILTGGELASMCISDAISRYVPNVLGNRESLNGESFENFLLEPPLFTKPNDFENSKVIKEYLKGNHAKIHALKNRLSICKTEYFRPDLYAKYKSKRKLEENR